MTTPRNGQAKRRMFWLAAGIVATLFLQNTVNSKGSTAAPEVDRYGTITAETPTVWDLARKEFPNEDPRKIVHEIRNMNQIDIGRVQAGQAIKLPK